MAPLRPAVVAWVIVIGVIAGSLLGVISEEVGNAVGVLIGLVAVWFGISLWTALGSTQVGGDSATAASWGTPLAFGPAC